MLFVELAEFSAFIALLDFYISGVLVLVFIETCVKLYFSQKISFKNIIECICFPIVMLMMVLIPIIKTMGFIKELVLNFIYVRRAYTFVSKTQFLNNEELIDCICKNFLKEDSLDIKFMSMTKIYIWSDNHFFHDNIIKYCNRPFEYSKGGSLECLKFQIENYLKTVKENDLCIFLGDLVYLNKCNVEKFEEMFNRLPGHKILVLGNHDRKNYDFKRLGFEHVLDYIIVGKTMFCHYPLINDSKYLKAFKENNCNILYHGHTHDKEIQSSDITRINCCVDYGNNNYTPIEISDCTLKSQILEKFDYL